MRGAKGRGWTFLLASLVIMLLTGSSAACGGDEGSSTGAGDSSEAAAANQEFIRPGGDNSVQRFGEEATAAEREAASTALETYLQARELGRWAEQCSYMSEEAKKPYKGFVLPGQPGNQGRGCLGALAKIGAQSPESTRTSTMLEPVASLRVEGNRGYALYHGIEGVDYVMPLVKEEGAWKIDSLVPIELP